MVRRKCDGCGGVFASRQSLFKHRNRGCGKGGKTINGGEDEALERVALSPILAHDQEGENHESSDDSEYLSSDDDDDDYWLWESFAMMCKRGDKDIFETLDGLLPLYKWSETDELFQKLMDGVQWAKIQGFRLPDSFNYAVYSNMTLILEAVKCNSDEDNFWSVLSKRRLPSGCKWLTGQPCHCQACFGHSLLTKVRRFVEIFYGMKADETIQKIMREEENGSSIEKAMDRYREGILENYERGQSMIEQCGIVDDPNRPRFHCSDDED